jgi:hypothetical protein
VLLGLTDAALAKILQDPVEAIKAEFEQKGSTDDQENLRCILNSLQRPGWGSGAQISVFFFSPTYIGQRCSSFLYPRTLTPPDKQFFWYSPSFTGVSLNDLMKHPHAVTAKLKLQHVLGLRLYTTSSYYVVNDPLRSDPLQRPHPFAATTYFIDQAVKMMRTVSAVLPGAHQAQTYWRGMRDLGLTMVYMDTFFTRKKNVRWFVWRAQPVILRSQV